MKNTSEGRSVTLRTNSISVDILPEGASVRSVHIPGVDHSLVLGTRQPSVYGSANRTFLGATVGRHANRIAFGRFELGGKTHQLSRNEPPHHLHGGTGGCWARDWTITETSERHAVLTLVSPDGEDGYPGEASLRATFSVEDEGVLAVDYEATVDRPGVMNLTSHLYFNLAGHGETRDHVLTIDADAYLPVDATLIPTGEEVAVEHGDFDFRRGRRLLDGPAALDHNFCLRGGRTADPRRTASLHCVASGVALVLETTEPGLQVYDGVAFDGSIMGLEGVPIGSYGGIALEPQGWPDAPNRERFPSARLMPGETYRHRSVYRFGRT